MTTGRLTFSRFITVLNSLQMMYPSSCTWCWSPAHTLDRGSCPEFWGAEFQAHLDVGLLEGRSEKQGFLGISHFAGGTLSQFCRNNPGFQRFSRQIRISMN